MNNREPDYQEIDDIPNIDKLPTNAEPGVFSTNRS